MTSIVFSRYIRLIYIKLAEAATVCIGPTHYSTNCLYFKYFRKSINKLIISLVNLENKYKLSPQKLYMRRINNQNLV